MKAAVQSVSLTCLRWVRTVDADVTVKQCSLKWKKIMRLGAYSKYYSRWTIKQWPMICISAHADSNISIHSEMNSDGYFMERNRTLGNTEQLWSAWSVSSTNYVYAICWYPHYRIRTRNSRMQAYAHSFLPFPAARLLATRVPAYKVGWAVSRDGMDSMYRLGTTVRMYWLQNWLRIASKV